MKERFRKIAPAFWYAIKKFRSWVFILIIEIIPGIIFYFPNIADPTKFKLPSLWVLIVMLLLFFLLSLVWLTLWELSKNSNGIAEFFGYKFLTYCNSTHFNLDENKKVLNAICYKERTIECIHGIVDCIGFSADHMEALLPFTSKDTFNIRLVEEESNGHTLSLEHPYNKTGRQLAFRVHFHPGVTKGEKITVKVKFELPHFSIAEYEYFNQLRSHTVTDNFDKHGGEYLGSYINRPTDEYSLNISFNKECKIKPKGFSAKYFGFPDTEETFRINSLVKSLKSQDGSYHIALNVKNPKVGMRYEYEWIPATREQLNNETIIIT